MHVIVAALVVFVAMWRLGRADAAPDEYSYRHCAEQYLHGMFSCNLEHPLLAKQLMSVGIFTSNNSIMTVRVVAAIFAIATALFCYLFAKDCSDQWGGLLAAASWGLLPQAGIEGHTVLEAVRIDRFALLDPFVACFFALALFAGWRWWTRGGLVYAGLTGAACAAAVSSKAPGALFIPVVCGVPLLARRHRRGVPSEAAATVLGALVVFVCSYVPAGFGGTMHQISYMFNFQLHHASGGALVLVAGHLYQHTPWWADARFAISGLTWPIALVLVLGAIYGVISHRKAVTWCLGGAFSIFLGVGLILRLSLPHYWIDWEPGLIVASALGIRSLCSTSKLRIIGACCVVALTVGSAYTIRAVATQGVGPYQRVVAATQCHVPCVAQFVGYSNILINYVPPGERVVIAPPRLRDGQFETDLRNGTRRVWVTPQLVVIDPSVLALHGTWQHYVANFLALAKQYGFVRIPTTSRIEVWAHHSPPRH